MEIFHGDRRRVVHTGRMVLKGCPFINDGMAAAILECTVYTCPRALQYCTTYSSTYACTRVRVRVLLACGPASIVVVEFSCRILVCTRQRWPPWQARVVSTHHDGPVRTPESAQAAVAPPQSARRRPRPGRGAWNRGGWACVIAEAEACRDGSQDPDPPAQAGARGVCAQPSAYGHHL